MPRSSRHKSHKQHKHSSKDAREHSDSEEDGNLKDRKGREEGAVRVSRDSASGEKRKLVSQSQDGKDLFGPGNGDLSEDYVASKRRKERADAAVTDRWNGGEDGRGESLAGDKKTKGDVSRPDSDKGPKSKALVDSKSKSSRRHESLSTRKEDNAGLAMESEEVKKNSSSSSSKVESKRKSEKDLGRKEVHQYKDAKDKERGAERDRKAQDVRRERSVETVPGTGVVGSEVSRKQGSQSGALEDKRQVKQEVENTEWQIQDELRNLELEKELEKRIRKRRDGSDDKDKYQDDVRDGNDRRLSTRDDRTKDGRYKDERHKDDKYREKYREDLDRDHRIRDEKRRDDRSSKDHTSDRSDIKLFRDDSKTLENCHKKSKPLDCDRDASPHLEDRGTRCKDNRGKKRSSDDNVDHSDLKSRSTKEHRSEVEKKSLSSGKVQSLADRGKSQSRHAGVDSTLSNSKWKSSPSSSTHFAKDQYRHSSKQAESKYSDSLSQERVRPNVTSSREFAGVSGIPERASESRSTEKPRSMEKSIQKDENHLGELSAERSPISDAQASSMQLMEKSPSSTSIDRRYSNRTTLRRSLDVEETGRRSSGSKDTRDYSANEDRGSRELPLEKPAADEFSQADGDTVSVSSSFNRTSHLPSSSPSLLPPPPPFRSGVDSPSNRYKRSGDPNVGRGQGNAWKGVPNWPSNGFMPFQHGPPGGFHAVMQQFPAPTLFGVRPSMELNHTGVPYHIPDADRFSGHGRPFGWRNPADDACPPHLHGWDGGNSLFGDESHMYGRPDWDQNRHLMSGRGWEASAEMWKGQNSGVNMELPTAPLEEDHLLRAPADEIWAGQSGQRSRNERSRFGSRAESIEIKRSNNTPPALNSTEAPVKTMREKMPEPSKTSNDDGARFCHIYLSKLDISVDLTHPELYKQCTSLLDLEANATDDEGGIKHVHLEEHRETGVKFSNTTLSTSLFPTIKDSVLQRALALYKKQREEMKAKLPVLSFPGSEPERVSTTDGKKPEPGPTSFVEKLEPDPTLDDEKLELDPALDEEKLELGLTTTGEKAEEPIPTPNQERAEEPVPTSDQEKAEEPVPTSVQEKAEEAVPTSDQGKMEVAVPTFDQEKPEEAAPNSCQEKAGEPVPNPEEKPEEPVPLPEEKPEEPVPIPEEKPEEPVPTSNHQEKVEAVATSDLEKLEEAVEDCSPLQYAAQATTNSPGNEEDLKRATDSKSNDSTNSAEEQTAFSDILCGPLGFTNGSSEACEAMTPESIECRLVNLSRIHNSPESTH